MLPSKSKALIVIDQLPLTAMADLNLADTSGLSLEFIPRTTPVGHATISTGMNPLAHGVQGREWYRQGVRFRIGDIVRAGATGAGLFGVVLRSALAASIKKQNPAAVVVVGAAKDFLPFVLGGSAADVLIYPTSTVPRPDSSGNLAMVVMARANTARGLLAAVLTAPRLRALLARVVGPIGGNVGIAQPSGPGIALTWQVPAVAAANWAASMIQHGAQIDRFYFDAIQTILSSQVFGSAPRFHLQSWFSTDLIAHAQGVGSPSYTQSRNGALAAASLLGNSGYSVAVTSDHGGRPTPKQSIFDPAAPATFVRANRVVPLPQSTWVLQSGDHLVGYDQVGPRSPSYLHEDGFGGLVPSAVPAVISGNSFAASQMPAFLVLPALDERFAGPGVSPQGGDHGACVDARGGLSAVDAMVPLVRFGPHRGLAKPSSLDGLAGWFLQF